MSSRLTRKEMKRDEVLESVGGFVDFLSRNLKTVLLAIAAVVVVILGLVLYRVMAEKKAVKGSVALAEALESYGAPIVAPGSEAGEGVDVSFPDAASRTAKARELFEQVAADYRGTAPGDIAGAYLGSIASVSGELETAREHWSAFLRSQRDNLLAQEVRLNLLAVDRKLGRGEELVDELRAELAAASSDLPEEVLLNQLGLTLEELDRTEEALDIYRRLVQDFPLSPYSRVANDRISSLESDSTS